MGVKRFIVLAGLAALAAGLRAESITGTITIKRHLTHRSVTPAVPVYQRGATVKLGKDSEQDPIRYELSHVVIYLEASEHVFCEVWYMRFLNLVNRFLQVVTFCIKHNAIDVDSERARFITTY